VPEATLERGLASVTFKSLRLDHLLRSVGAALGGADIRRQRWMDVRIDQPEIVVEGHGPFPYQVDGDYLGEIDRLDVKHAPGALRLVLPG
jgi:diacylglycerol kinase family enzyme